MQDHVFLRAPYLRPEPTDMSIAQTSTQSEWSNLAKVVFNRTYARRDSGFLEKFPDAVERVLAGNVRSHNVSAHEIERLRYFLLNRKAGPAGRGWWFSGTEAHSRIGGVALSNCWGLTADSWENFVIAQDLLMLGGGVGLSVEHRFISKIPRIKRSVEIRHKASKDADLIVPDSREGWCELLRRVLESFFVTGRSFTYSTVCIRGAGERILGFGGTSSGPFPLISMVEKICAILLNREGRALRPIDAADILCAIGEMVVSGNVRRSAIIIMGDPWDREYLKAKRWDLGPIPTQRSCANWSVIAEDVEELHSLFWKTFEAGEAFGLVNRTAIQRFGRIGELKKDSATVVNPCVPAGTEILTVTGYRRIEECLGETVQVWNGFEFSPVQPQVTGYSQPLVRVTLSSGQSLVCTPAHNFYIQDSYRAAPRLEKASALTSGVKLAKTRMPPVLSGEVVDTRQAYSQGFYSGDGDFSGNFVMLYGDKHKCAGRLKGTAFSYDETQDRTRVAFDFSTKDKEFVPFSWDFVSRMHWLAGLLDSDGTVLVEGGAQISSINEKFLLDAQKLLTTLGVTSKVIGVCAAGLRPLPDGHGGKRDYECQAGFRLCIGSTQMYDLWRAGLRCERVTLNERRPQRDASQFVTVVSIEDAGVAGTVYCFKEGIRGLGCFEGIVTGQCAEATLESGENCNLQEIALPNIADESEFIEAARLMHRWGKRVSLEPLHHKLSADVVARNRRVGTGITGCLASPLFNPQTLDAAYAAIQAENVQYSKELGINESIRTTVVKPSGTMSKMMDMQGYEGIHPAYSRYIIQRVRFAANDPLIPLLLDAGHYMEPVSKFDGSLDHGTIVVDFYEEAGNGPVADEDWDTWKQLDAVKTAQRHWADQAVSVSVYYKREDIGKIKEWLTANLAETKTISFLCHSEHGFKQAPKEAISKKEFDRLSKRIQPVDISKLSSEEFSMDGTECAGGACPVK